MSWGAGRRKYRYTRTRAAAEKALKALMRAREAGQAPPNDRYTVAQYLADWLETSAVQRKRPSTIDSYAANIRLHIVPAIGRLRLQQLGPLDVDAMLQAAEARGLSARSVQYVHAILRVALSDAQRMELVSRNVAKLVQPPSAGRHELDVLSADEARQILAAVRTDRLAALYTLAFLGLRRGELIGLRWVDVDLDAATLQVRHQVQQTDAGVSFVPLKTHRSRRPLPLPGFIVDALRAQKIAVAEERLIGGSRWTDHGLVFPSSAGTPLDPRNVYRRFHQLLDAAAIRRVRLHDLRHGCASLLRAQGVDLKIIQAILGHSTLSLTADTYAHIYAEELRAAVNVLHSIMATDAG